MEKLIVKSIEKLLVPKSVLLNVWFNLQEQSIKLKKPSFDAHLSKASLCLLNPSDPGETDNFYHSILHGDDLVLLGQDLLQIRD